MDDHLKSPKHSVLLLGKTQVGKSTFLEFVKNYANPAYTIDESLIGAGFRPKAQTPVQFVVKTDLPAYEVFDSSGARIDISALHDKYEDPEEYYDALNDRKAVLRTVPLDPNTPPPRDTDITFLDTPGIEDTNGRDMEHAHNIIREMVRMRSFNLIVIVINCEEAPSRCLQLAFNYYSQVIQLLQGHLSNVIFLYTHVDYEKMHPSNSNHIPVMELRHRAFSRLFSRQGHKSHQGPFGLSKTSEEIIELFPEYNIDFDRRQRPITKCMRLNTLRHILKLVVENPPSPLDTSEENLDRVWRIQHPDALNQALREAILTRTRAMMEGREDSSAPTGDSEDYEGYFDGSPDPSTDDDDALREAILTRTRAIMEGREDSSAPTGDSEDYEGYFDGSPDPSTDDDDVEE
ncbi:MAG: hypothetical protein BYD32DRAFT_431810 [Podila humilis]|nr:MAG: hypothetical protein BYD32DRAFT_431810 [Podila humilis]